MQKVLLQVTEREIALQSLNLEDLPSLSPIRILEHTRKHRHGVALAQLVVRSSNRHKHEVTREPLVSTQGLNLNIGSLIVII